MKEFGKLRIDAKARKLFFGCGECDKVRDICEAICCRIYDVTLSDKELLSGIYDVRYVCRLNNSSCERPLSRCANRLVYLNKRADGSCVYLSEENKCSIHAKRPESCRRFDCKEGWSLSYAYPSSCAKDSVYMKECFNEHINRLFSGDMRFAPNPGVKLKTVFLSADKKTIHIVKEMKEKCGLAASKRTFDASDIGESFVPAALGLFDGKRTLDEVRSLVTGPEGMPLSREAFFRIVWFLRTEGLIAFMHPEGVFERKTDGGPE